MAVWTKRVRVAVSIACLGTMAAGCSHIRNHQGYIADMTLVQSIQPGVDNRDSVMKTLGRPSFDAEFDKKEWYYIGRDTSQLGYNRPKPQKQMLLIVAFDQNGTVSSVKQRGLEEVANVGMVKDKTPTLGRKTGFWQDFFGNIGSVGAGGAGAGGGAGGDTP